jgi:hypothetical protein
MDLELTPVTHRYKYNTKHATYSITFGIKTQGSRERTTWTQKEQRGVLSKRIVIFIAHS